ncbi:hypothetical protein AAHE18_17G126500 [Arachis hypogaea]
MTELETLLLLPFVLSHCCHCSALLPLSRAIECFCCENITKIAAAATNWG